MDMNGKRVLVTGGTGTVGMALVQRLLGPFPGVRQILVYSRDEQKHFEMAAKLPPAEVPVRYIVGDVRDRDRLMHACRGVDILVHTASMKHVALSEQNPIECAKTNIFGSHNVIDAAVANDIERVVTLTTDKAVLPINAYGASKLFLERLFLDADHQCATKFSVVRFANVFGSKGSVVPLFLRAREQGYLPITDPRMTRFSITMQEAMDLILFALEEGWGGEVIVPVSPSYRILDVAEAIAPGVEQRVMGARPGEKIHEFMVGAHEAEQTVRLGQRLVICPKEGAWDAEGYCDRTGATRVPSGFEYDSETNSDWLTVEQIREMLSDLADA